MKRAILVTKSTYSCGHILLLASTGSSATCSSITQRQSSMRKGLRISLIFDAKSSVCHTSNNMGWICGVGGGKSYDRQCDCGQRPETRFR